VAEIIDQLHDVSIEDVARRMAAGMAGSPADQAARAEFARRQTVAAQDTASATQKYTRYMFWSVVVLAASAFGSLLLEGARALAGK
jgi:hypothetical protein